MRKKLTSGRAASSPPSSSSPSWSCTRWSRSIHMASPRIPQTAKSRATMFFLACRCTRACARGTSIEPAAVRLPLYRVPGELTCFPPNLDSAPKHKVDAWLVGIGLVVSIFAICASLLQSCGPRTKCRIQLARKLDELSWKLTELSSSVSMKAPRRGEQSSHQSSSD